MMTPVQKAKYNIYRAAWRAQKRSQDEEGYLAQQRQWELKRDPEKKKENSRESYYRCREARLRNMANYRARKKAGK